MDWKLLRSLLLMVGCLAFVGVVALRASSEYLRRSAEDQLWRGETQEAERRFALTAWIDPLSHAASVGRADALLADAERLVLGSPEQLRTLERTITLYREVLGANPRDPYSWAQVGRAYRWVAVARRATRSIDISRVGQEGEELFGQAEDELAVAALLRALEIEPHSYVYADYLAELRYVLGKEDALEWYRRGTRILPRLQGHPYLEDRHLPIEIARAAIQGARDAVGTGNVVADFKILEELSTFHARWGQYEEALAANLEAVEAGYPTLGYLWTRQGRWLDDLGRTEEAREAFLLALEADPARASAAYGLGVIELREGNLDEALEHFRGARDLMPDVLRFQIQLAKTYALAGSLEEASREYERVLRMKGGEVAAATALVDLYRRQGIYDRALVYAQRLADRYPGEQAFQRQVEDLKARLTF